MNDNTPRWRVPALAWVPITMAVLAEAASNALRAYGLMAHLDTYTIIYEGHAVSLAGGGFVLAALAVSLCQARSAWLAIMPGSTRQRLVAAPVALLLLAVSALAMSSHVLEALRAKTSDEGGAQTTHDIAKNEYTKIEGKIAALRRFGEKGDQLPRSRDVVQGDIDKLEFKAGPEWSAWIASKRCTDITREATKIVCDRVLPLYAEQGASAELVQLEPKLAEARATLEKNPAPPKKATDVEEQVAWIWGWLIGAAIVFIATFGTILWARPVEVPASTAAAAADVPAAPSAVETPAATPDVTVAPLRPSARLLTELPQPPKPRKRAKRKQQKRTVAIAKLRQRTLAGEKPTLKVIMSRHGVSKATASRWRTAAMA